MAKGQYRRQLTIVVTNFPTGLPLVAFVSSERLKSLLRFGEGSKSIDPAKDAASRPEYAVGGDVVSGPHTDFRVISS